MNQMQKRHAILPNYPQYTDIVSVCQGLHSSVIGASEPYPLTEHVQKAAFLRCCLETWEDQGGLSAIYDQAIQRLIEATLDEVHRYLKQCPQETSNV